MVALARNLNFLRSRFLTGLTAVFVAWLRCAQAGNVRTLVLLSCRHRDSPFLDWTEEYRGRQLTLGRLRRRDTQATRLIARPNLVASEIDQTGPRELLPEAAEYGSLDRLRW